MDLYLVWMIHSTQSPEIRSFWLMKLSNEMLQYILKKKENFKNLVAHYKLYAVTLDSAIVLQMQMFYLHHCFKKKREGWKSNRNCSTSILLNCYEKREKKNCSKMKTQRGPYKIILCISLQHLLVVNGSKLVIVVKFVWTFWIIRL